MLFICLSLFECQAIPESTTTRKLGKTVQILKDHAAKAALATKKRIEIIRYGEKASPIYLAEQRDKYNRNIQEGLAEIMRERAQNKQRP